MSQHGRAPIVGLDPDARPGASEERWESFCSYCGHSPEPGFETRVCESCGLGLVLRAPSDLAPTEGVAFVVVDASLTVGAVSDVAERFLEVAEATSVHRPVTELMEAADSEGAGTDLATAIMWAARGDRTHRELYVRPANTFGVRCRASIGPCGPPSAALVVLEDHAS